MLGAYFGASAAVAAMRSQSLPILTRCILTRCMFRRIVVFYRRGSCRHVPPHVRSTLLLPQSPPFTRAIFASQFALAADAFYFRSSSGTASARPLLAVHTLQLVSPPPKTAPCWAKGTTTCTPPHPDRPAYCKRCIVGLGISHLYTVDLSRGPGSSLLPHQASSTVRHSSLVKYGSTVKIARTALALLISPLAAN